MRKLILLTFGILLFVEYGQTEVLVQSNSESVLKQDPKTKNQNKQKTKKSEKKDMLDKKISISDENQPINKSKTKKSK